MATESQVHQTECHDHAMGLIRIPQSGEENGNESAVKMNGRVDNSNNLMINDGLEIIAQSVLIHPNLTRQHGGCSGPRRSTRNLSRPKSKRKKKRVQLQRKMIKTQLGPAPNNKSPPQHDLDVSSVDHGSDGSGNCSELTGKTREAVRLNRTLANRRHSSKGAAVTAPATQSENPTQPSTLVSRLHQPPATADAPSPPQPVQPGPNEWAQQGYQAHVLRQYLEISTSNARPTLHEKFYQFSAKTRFQVIKKYLGSFEYKTSPGTCFNTCKERPLTRLMDVARMIIYSPKPIKCVEAVFLSLHLTRGILDCERIPLSFKTSCAGQVHRHIVLLVHHEGKFGAFGISRHPGLMTKDITFTKISEIVEDYKRVYEEAHHVLLKVQVGLLFIVVTLHACGSKTFTIEKVEHKEDSVNFICWNHLSLDLLKLSWQQCCEALESHHPKQRSFWNQWILGGKGSDPRRKCRARKPSLDSNLVRRKTRKHRDCQDEAVRNNVSTNDERLVKMAHRVAGTAHSGDEHKARRAKSCKTSASAEEPRGQKKDLEQLQTKMTILKRPQHKYTKLHPSKRLILAKTKIMYRIIRANKGRDVRRPFRS